MTGPRDPRLSRRRALQTLACGAAAAALSIGGSRARATDAASLMRTRPIPSTGEPIGVVGVGTSRVFDVAGDAAEEAARRDVLQTLFDAGGSLIDTAPNYATSQPLVGRLVADMDARERAFFATKVMAETQDDAQRQYDACHAELRAPTIDLMQVHSLVAWRTRLPELRAAKDAGRARYIGVTDATPAGFETIGEIIRTEPIDFVQIPYSLHERAAEDELLARAADAGVAVIANQPFGSGRLFSRVRGMPVPDLAGELGLDSWAQMFLAFAASHPGVTAAIPGTGRVAHMLENAGVGARPPLTAAERDRIVRFWIAL